MMSPRVKQLVVIGAMLLALPVVAHGQEATIIGTVTDATGAVLPGVAITAVHDTTGNRFSSVTDALGKYQIPARIGTYQITASLQGFTTVERPGVTLLVGQTVAINIQMTVSTVSETITVTGESPLIDISSSALGGNIDAKQMEELPVQGRNWANLALLAPGNRTTAMGAGQPIQDRNDGEVREFQLNLDGQQITSNLGTGNQPMLQPRLDRGVSVHLEPVRCHARAVCRRAGERHHEVGTNRLMGRSAATSATTPSMPPIPCCTAFYPSRISRYSTTVGGPIVKTSCTSSATSNTSARHDRPPLTRATRSSTST